MEPDGDNGVTQVLSGPEKFNRSDSQQEPFLKRIGGFENELMEARDECLAGDFDLHTLAVPYGNFFTDDATLERRSQGTAIVVRLIQS